MMLGDDNLCLFGTDASGECLPPPPKTGKPWFVSPWVGIGLVATIVGVLALALRKS